jgi:hypothetical protein
MRRRDDERHKRVEAVALGSGEEDAVVAGRRRSSLQLEGGWKGDDTPVDLKEKVCEAKLTSDHGKR